MPETPEPVPVPVPVTVPGSVRPAHPAPAQDPAWVEDSVAQFRRHVAAERGLSPHTVRGYVGDARSLLSHADQCGVDGPGELTAPVLRSWLAGQHQAGASRATLARRGAAARAFTAFAHQRGWLASDPGTALGTPKVRRTLPHVLKQREISDVLASAAADADQPPPDRTPAGTALALRDAAILELLYATGIRVSELCGLDLDALDLGRRTVRVFGKGGKERTVPVGLPAVRAVGRWQQAGRPVLVTAASRAALFIGARGGRLDPR
ncbi:MAG TPA: tyrosine-type recombinase/integrase, partial [Streptosporangiaceae bacterium]